jgi:hypothetical protein
MLAVAIVAENDDHDAEIYRRLLELLLRQPVARYPTQRKFSGCRSVRDLSTPYLEEAARHGVRHALFAVDNDGGRKKHPEHEPTHDQRAEAVDKHGCRVCWLAQNLPASWAGDARRRCLVVPVQTIETWLLCLRHHDFKEPTPEQRYHRDALKGDFFGKPLPPATIQRRLALAELDKPGALDILRERRSFRHFEAQLADWP